MTDLGNGLVAISVPKDATEIYTALNSTALTWKHKAIIKSVKFDYDAELLGTVTKGNIDFDVDTYVECENGRFKNYQTKDAFIVLTSELSFRSLLASKGLYFENHYGEKPDLTHFNPNEYDVRIGEWQERENNLIEKLVIIKKV